MTGRSDELLAENIYTHTPIKAKKMRILTKKENQHCDKSDGSEKEREGAIRNNDDELHLNSCSYTTTVQEETPIQHSRLDEVSYF